MKLKYLINVKTKALILTALLALSPVASWSGEGTSSGGGGGYGDESSNYLLNLAGNELVQRLKNGAPEMFANLPKHFVPTLIKLVDPKNIALEPETSFSRDNRELMFDYRTSPEGEGYLVALKLFFKAHASVPVNFMEYGALHQMKKEIQMRLLHEAAHVLNIGTSEQTDGNARAFAKALLHAFDRDYIFCEIPSWISQKTHYVLLLNRGLGFGLLNSTGYNLEFDDAQKYLDGAAVFKPAYTKGLTEAILDPLDSADFNPGSFEGLSRPLSQGASKVWSDIINVQFNTVRTKGAQTTLSFSGYSMKTDKNPSGMLNEKLIINGLNSKTATSARLISDLTIKGKIQREQYDASCRSSYEVVRIKLN